MNEKYITPCNYSITLCSEIDHVGYSCDSLDEYKKICREIQGRHGTLLVEGIINGRPISTFKLHAPVTLRNLSIPYVLPTHTKSSYRCRCIEIAAPKPGSNYKHGLQHFEYVIGNSEDGVFDNAPLLQRFMAQYSGRSNTKQHHL